MKLTYKEDIFLLDKLFQLRSIRNQPTLLEKSEMEELQGKVVVVFGGTYGIGQDICEICREYKTSLYVYSRSTGVDVSNSQSVRRVLSEYYCCKRIFFLFERK